MRESVGNSWQFGLIITFTFLFACFLCLAINYSKAFRLKNEVISIIEKYEGFNDNSHKIINNYLSSNGYNTMGKCSSVTDKADNDITKDNILVDNLSYENDKKYYYCIKEEPTKNNKKKYNVTLFYNFTLPFLGDFATFKIDGNTIELVE